MLGAATSQQSEPDRGSRRPQRSCEDRSRPGARRWLQRLRLGLSLSCLAFLAVPLGGLPREKDVWLRVETPNFTFFSNSSRANTLRIADNLERLHGVLVELRRNAPVNAPLPTKIFIFKGDASFELYKPRDPLRPGRPAPVAGYFQASPFGNYVAINGDPQADPTEIVYHEYLHFFAEHNFPDVPLWFNEGLAELYSNFEIEDGVALLGRPKHRHVAALRTRRLIPMAKLLAVDPSSELYNERKRQGLFYAQAWALVHYFLTGDEARRLEVAQYLDLVAAGEEPSRALKEAFGMTYARLERALDSYVDQDEFSFLRIPLPGPAAVVELQIEPMSHAEVLFELGDLLAHQQPSRAEEARDHLEKALNLRQEDGLAQATLGYLEEVESNLPSALSLYEGATQLASEHYLPWFLLGAALLRSVSERLQGSAELDAESQSDAARAREALERSLERNADFGPTYAALGATYLLDQPTLPEGLAVLREAHRRLPARPDVTFHLAVILGRLGHFGEAHELVDQMVARPQSLEYGRLARSEIARRELEAAAKLIEAGELDAGLRQAEAIFADAEAPLVRELAPLLEKVRERVGHARLVKRFNEAVQLANRQRLSEALEIVREVRAEATEPRLESAAQELERRLEAHLTEPR